MEFSDETWYMGIVVGTSTNSTCVYKFMRVIHPICICSDWNMGYKDETWYVGSGGHKYHLRGPQEAGPQIFQYLPRHPRCMYCEHI